MDLMPTAEQDAIRDSVRSFLDAELPMSRVRALCGAAGDAYAPLWRAAAELGLFADYALTEQMVLFEELGRALAPGPWLGTVLAAPALAAGGHAAAAARERAARRASRSASIPGAGRSRCAPTACRERATRCSAPASPTPSWWSTTPACCSWRATPG